MMTAFTWVRRHPRSLLFTAACLAAGPACSAPARDRTTGCETISYSVGIQDTAYFHVRLRFRAKGQTQGLFMAENAPGGLREVYGRFLEALRAETDGGRPLPVHRTGPSTWAIGTDAAPCVTVTYLLQRHLDDEIRLVSNAIESDDAYFVGATILLGLEGRTTEPTVLALQPPGSSSVWTTLPAEEPTTFRASSYQELAWAPVLIGNARPLNIALADGALRVVAFGAPSDSLLEPIAARFQEIARCQEELFGFLPEQRILVGLRWREDLDYGGGVSRRNAVVMNIGHDWMPDPTRFASSTFAHELFHTWNFGLFYPAESRPWQPFGSTATRALWLVEGLTNYYVMQTFVRLRRIDAQRALDWIASEITSFETSPARAWASLEDGGPMADAGALRSIDVRAGGFVVGFVLDAMIRRDTNGRSSLDDVVRTLAISARQDHYAGYTAEDLVRVVRSVGGDRATAAYLQLVSRPGPIDYDELLEGTAYRVETVLDSTAAGGRRWQVAQLTVTDPTKSHLGVLGTDCARAQERSAATPR